MKIDRVSIRKQLEELFPGRRMEHIIGVEYTAAALAMQYGIDIEQAAAAGLLHDCAKYVPNEEKISICTKKGLGVSDAERQNPELLHAKLSADYAKEIYGVTDQSILDAIACHTTGKPDMTTLDKIIYVADYMEPNRNKAPRLDKVRKLAFEDLDQCLIHILESTLTFLQSSGAIVDDTTIQTYEYYKKQK